MAKTQYVTGEENLFKKIGSYKLFCSQNAYEKLKIEVQEN